MRHFHTKLKQNFASLRSVFMVDIPRYRSVSAGLGFDGVGVSQGGAAVMNTTAARRLSGKL